MKIGLIIFGLMLIAGIADAADIVNTYSDGIMSVYQNIYYCNNTYLVNAFIDNTSACYAPLHCTVKFYDSYEGYYVYTNEFIGLPEFDFFNSSSPLDTEYEWQYRLYDENNTLIDVSDLIPYTILCSTTTTTEETTTSTTTTTTEATTTTTLGENCYSNNSASFCITNYEEDCIDNYPVVWITIDPVGPGILYESFYCDTAYYSEENCTWENVWNNPLGAGIDGVVLASYSSIQHGGFNHDYLYRIYYYSGYEDMNYPPSDPSSGATYLVDSGFLHYNFSSEFCYNCLNPVTTTTTMPSNPCNGMDSTCTGNDLTGISPITGDLCVNDYTQQFLCSEPEHINCMQIAWYDDACHGTEFSCLCYMGITTTTFSTTSTTWTTLNSTSNYNPAVPEINCSNLTGKMIMGNFWYPALCAGIIPLGGSITPGGSWSYAFGITWTYGFIMIFLMAFVYVVTKRYVAVGITGLLTLSILMDSLPPIFRILAGVVLSFIIAGLIVRFINGRKEEDNPRRAKITRGPPEGWEAS